MSDSVFGPRIIQNLLDTDFYKITMMQAVLHNYPNAEVEWEFRCRNGEDLSPYLAEIRYQVEQLAEVSVTHDQLTYLEKIPFIKPDFIRFLSLFRFNLRYVQIGLDATGQLAIRVRGPWLHVILYEIPLLAIISEVRNRYRYRDVVIEQVGERLYQKLDWLKAEASAEELAGYQLADFGTFFTYVAIGPIDGFSVQELRTALTALPIDGLEESAQALSQALSGVVARISNHIVNGQLVPERAGKRHSEETIDAVRSLKAEGKTQKEIYEALGLSRSTVGRIWKGLN